MWDQGPGGGRDLGPSSSPSPGWMAICFCTFLPAHPPACVWPSGLCVTFRVLCAAPFTPKLASSPYSSEGRSWLSVASVVFSGRQKLHSGFFFFLFLTLFLNPPLLYLWNLLYYLVITFSLKFPKDSLIIFIFPAFSSFRFGTSSFYTLPFLFFPFLSKFVTFHFLNTKAFMVTSHLWL